MTAIGAGADRSNRINQGEAMSADLKVHFEAAFDRVLSSGAIEHALEKELKSTIDGIVRQQFGNYSPFSKALEEVLVEKLKLNLQEIELAEYNAQIVKIVNRLVANSVDRKLDVEIAKRVEDLLQMPPAVVTLSSLVDEFFKAAKEDSCHCDEPNHRAEVKVDRGSCNGYWRLSLWKEFDRTKSVQADIEAAFDSSGRCYSICVRYSGEIDRQFFVGPMYDLSKKLFQIKCARVPVQRDTEQYNQ